MSEKLYSLDFVKEMAGGNKEFIQTLLQLFVDTVPDSITKINEHYEKGNFDSMAKEAHKLKSTINTVQVPSFIEKIKEMEIEAKTGQKTTRLEVLIHEFNDIMPKVVGQIREELNTN
jgi:HPt (histidine-containing phosphotransfer) domain-containing protein